ncbi:hypothetical protein L9F63_024297 [Diploptera punctata]|uniref:SOCS box domain-containing protein n=1 Tax=Diploptera punctata TaxID=6984 RepID=A0AAD7ZHI5_DIPPU|nr:hypothetical protein L9F63_024297 [Diploptera punctata]
MIVGTGELQDFIVDSEDGQYDDSLHQAAWRGDVSEVERLLSKSMACLNLQLRPFGATPLRLAAMNGQTPCVELLLRYGAHVDLPDRKGQTPLFCAVKNWDTDTCVLLLKAGACPDGDRMNLSTPLYLACQDGYSVGVKLLLDYGAEIEWPDVRPTWLHPLHVAVTYKHVSCFVLLLLSGADLPRAGHVLHLICSRKCDPIFLNLWAEFGGNFWDRDSKGQLAAELPDNPYRDILLNFMETPLSLQSLCRLVIRKMLGRNRLHLLNELDVTGVLTDFLTYKDVPGVNLTLTSVQAQLAKCSYS